MKKQITAALLAMVLIMPSATFADDKVKSLVAAEARAQGVPVDLALAVARVESTYNCKAHNAGSIGLMQIKFPTAKSVGYKGNAKGLYDCATNAKYGVAYLKLALERANGNYCHAATLYNRGVYAKPKSSGYCKKVLGYM